MLLGKTISIIFTAPVYAKNNRLIIGNGKFIPWLGKVSSDLKRFKKLTLNQTVIMGRKTWDSLEHKPLPDRQNIILSRNPDIIFEPSDIPLKDWTFLEIGVTKSFESAILMAKSQTVWIIGGAEIYKLALPYVDYIHRTLISGRFDGDIFFPEYNLNEWRKDKEKSIFLKAKELENTMDEYDSFYEVFERKEVI